MSKWVLQTPPILHPTVKATEQLEFKFDTKKELENYCKMEGISFEKKKGCKYIYIILKAPPKYFKWRNHYSWNKYTGLRD